MKISELIADIICEAELKFGVLDTSDSARIHPNETISVWIFYADFDEWQVGLERPSQNQLDRGVVEDCTSCKLAEFKVAFYTMAPTLLGALRALQYKVLEADSWVFPA